MFLKEQQAVAHAPIAWNDYVENIENCI